MRMVHRTGPLLLALGIAAAGCGPAGTPAGKPIGEEAGAAAKAYPAADLVVLEVPDMHGAVSGTAAVRSALRTLPWVEADSIQASAQTREASFALKDKSKFDMKEIEDVLKEKGYERVTLKSKPGGAEE